MTDARGKLGGQVFSKNRSGAYIRTKVTPVNPRTASQQKNRATLGQLSQAWSGLTDPERASWNGAVDSWAKSNIFGDSSKPTGKALFVGLNKNLIATQQDQLTICPDRTETPINDFTTAHIGIATTVIQVSGEMLGSSGSLIVSATPPLSAGTSFLKGKFRDLVGGEISIMTGVGLWGAYVAKFGVPAVGQNIHFSVKTVSASGQVSVPRIVKATIA